MVSVFFARRFYQLAILFAQDEYYWPLLCVAFGLCCYPLLSTIAHLFSSMNIEVRHFVFYMDYLGISIYSCSISMGFLAYTAPEHVHTSSIVYIYTYTSVALIIMSFLGCCLSRHYSDQNWGSILRLSALSIPFVFVCTFMFWWLMYNKSSPIDHHYMHLICNPVVGLIFALRLPERFVPVSFDLIGQSHQLFHVASFITSNFHFEAILKDCQMKQAEITRRNVSHLTIQAFSMVLLADFIILYYFKSKLWPAIKKNVKER